MEIKELKGVLNHNNLIVSIPKRYNKEFPDRVLIDIDISKLKPRKDEK